MVKQKQHNLETKKIREILDLMIEKRVLSFEYKNLKVQLSPPLVIQEDIKDNSHKLISDDELLFMGSID